MPGRRLPDESVTVPLTKPPSIRERLKNLTGMSLLIQNFCPEPIFHQGPGKHLVDCKAQLKPVSISTQFAMELSLNPHLGIWSDTEMVTENGCWIVSPQPWPGGERVAC